MDEIIADKKSLGDIFKHSLKIPEYQREYAWKNEQIDDFLNDLLRFAEADKGEYVFGTIIAHVCGDDKNHVIVDGQQRLCTASMCFKILFDLIGEVYDPDDWDLSAWRNSLSCFKIKKGSSRVPTLKMNSKNYTFYKEYVIDGEDVKPIEKSDILIKKAYKRIENKFRKEMEEMDILDKRAYLCNVSEKLLDDFKVIYVKTDN